MIKKNEELAKSFINQYANYGITIIEVEEKFNLIKYIRELSEYAKNTGRKPTDEEISLMLDEFDKKREEKIKLEEEKIKPDKEKIQSILKSFTQEMLILIHTMCKNSKLKEEVLEQIRKNNSDIDYLNNLASESGSIFQELELMQKEELVRLVSLRETTEEIILERIKLQVLNSDVIKMITKVMNNQSLEQEKISFCVQHNLSNELEFQFYQKAIKNKNFLDAATEVQKSFNELTHNEDKTIIDMAYDNMSKITIGIVGKKK